MIHSFDVDHAQKYGLEAAILIYNIDFWIRKNKANQKHFYEGRYWTYNSVGAFIELFPYMTKDVIRKRLDYLVDEKVLIKGFFSGDKRDRTSWYTLDYSLLHLAVEPNAIDQAAKCSLVYTDSKHTDSKHTEVDTSDQLFKTDVVVKNNTIAKRGKEKKPVDGSYQEFVRIWCAAYPILGFDAVSGKVVKELIVKTQSVLVAMGSVPTAELTCKTFQYVVDYVKRTGHFCDGKPITTFSQQYKSIVLEIKKGNDGQKSRESGSDSLNEYLKSYYGLTTAR